MSLKGMLVGLPIMFMTAFISVYAGILVARIDGKEAYTPKKKRVLKVVVLAVSAAAVGVIMHFLQTRILLI